MASLSANTLAGFSLDATSGVAIDTTAAGSSPQNGAIIGTRSLTKLGDGVPNSSVSIGASTLDGSGFLVAASSSGFDTWKTTNSGEDPTVGSASIASTLTPGTPAKIFLRLQVLSN